VGFGRGPLSHPLLVEAIEDDFVPVLVFNNKSGVDARWLERFGEPAWNNPVVRFIGRDGKDSIVRRDRVWSTSDVAARLIDAERAQGRNALPYLDVVRLESECEHHATCAFAMHCFWEGEARLGAIDGVVGVEARSLGGREIVAVTYHAGELPFAKLVAAADRLDCAVAVLTTSDEQLSAARAAVGERARAWDGKSSERPRSDRTHALNASPLRFLPLTSMQAMKVNSAVAAGDDARRWLSPRQVELARKVDAALARDAKKLDGLERPSSIAALWDYAEQLRRRL
jgi:hypothetical protein